MRCRKICGLGLNRKTVSIIGRTKKYIFCFRKLWKFQSTRRLSIRIETRTVCLGCYYVDKCYQKVLFFFCSGYLLRLDHSYGGRFLVCRYWSEICKFWVASNLLLAKCVFFFFDRRVVSNQIPGLDFKKRIYKCLIFIVRKKKFFSLFVLCFSST